MKTSAIFIMMITIYEHISLHNTKRIWYQSTFWNTYTHHIPIRQNSKIVKYIGDNTIWIVQLEWWIYQILSPIYTLLWICDVKVNVYKLILC